MFDTYGTNRQGLIFGLLAAVAVGLIDVLYVIVMNGQGAQYLSYTRVRFEMSFLLAMALAAGAGAIVPWRLLRVALLSSAAVGLLCSGVLSLLSIGYLELGASGLAGLALIRVVQGRVRHGARLALIMGGALAATALVVGVKLTSIG